MIPTNFELFKQYRLASSTRPSLFRPFQCDPPARDNLKRILPDAIDEENVILIKIDWELCIESRLREVGQALATRADGASLHDFKVAFTSRRPAILLRLSHYISRLIPHAMPSPYMAQRLQCTECVQSNLGLTMRLHILHRSKSEFTRTQR